MKLITCTAAAAALLWAGCGGYTPIGEGETTGGSSGAGGDSTMTGGTGSTGGTSMTGGTGGTSMTGGTGSTGGTSMTGGTGGTTMTGGTGGTGMGGACANKPCGSPCTYCAGGEPSCNADVIAMAYCDAQGSCLPSFPMCQPNSCESSMECAVDLSCQVCADGSYACPTAECVMGQCITSYPTCPGTQCTTAEQCPVSDAPCTMCLDGTTQCPWSDCVNGVCVSGIDGCDNASPCEGKSCGDSCSPCVGANCDAAAPIMAASYCDANLDCVFNLPMCGTDQCKADSECIAPEICMACPDTAMCATMKCLSGSCQWQCPGKDPCGGCGMEQVCVYQIGGPGPSHYACATVSQCEAADPCACVQGQGSCKQSMEDMYCHCENGLE